VSLPPLPVVFVLNFFCDPSPPHLSIPFQVNAGWYIIGGGTFGTHFLKYLLELFDIYGPCGMWGQHLIQVRKAARVSCQLIERLA
jgi:hypothetical protein